MKQNKVNEQLKALEKVELIFPDTDKMIAVEVL